MKAFIHYIVSLSATFLFIHSAQAAVMLSGGLTHEHTVLAGQTVSGVLELRNASNKPEEIKIYQGDSAPNVGDQDHERSNRNWLQLSTNHIVLNPGERRTIEYTLEVPTQVGKGTYWSMLYLEPVSENSRESHIRKPQLEENKGFTIGISQKVRYGVSILTHSGDGQSELSFAEPNIATNTKQQKEFSIAINNTGERFVRPKVSLEVFDMKGQSITTLQASSHRTFYPGSNKRISIPLEGLPPATYKALLIAEAPHSGRTFGVDINLDIKP